MIIKGKYGDVDGTRYPIIVTKTYSIDPTDAEIEEFFGNLETFLNATEGPYVFVSYTEGAARFISSEARIKIGKMANSISEKYEKRNKGSIIVMNGVIASMMLKAISLVYKPLKDSIIVSSLDEANKKATILLEQKK